MLCCYKLIIDNAVNITLLFRKEGKFYCDDQDLPVYMWTNSKTQFSVEELARLLLIESTVPQNKICSKQPVRVSHNVSFVVDLHALDDPKDIRADENGVWQRNGSPLTYGQFRVNEVKF